jgi:hypothetical protein
MPPTFLPALAQAVATVSRESARLALTRIQLRGRAGEIVATDGKQLLVQGGFSFPWTEDILVPAVPAFGQRELATADGMALGRTATHLAMHVGPWTFLLAFDSQGRFPDAAKVIPSPEGVTSRLRLDPEDAAALLAALPRLPGRADEHAPVTLDLGRRPAVRARAEAEAEATEVVLARSARAGRPVRLCTDRSFLRRALQLGFTEIQIRSPKDSICCRDASRCYVWVPLDPERALTNDPDKREVSTAQLPVVPSPTLSPERIDPMPPTRVNGDPAPDNDKPQGQPLPASLVELIAEGESLRELLHEVYGRCSRLVAALKHQRRQAQAVQAAMASLRKLQLDP